MTKTAKIRHFIFFLSALLASVDCGVKRGDPKAFEISSGTHLNKIHFLLELGWGRGYYLLSAASSGGRWLAGEYRKIRSMSRSRLND